nr:hypothetical protein [Tanacetum cinerariifolium]
MKPDPKKKVMGSVSHGNRLTKPHTISKRLEDPEDKRLSFQISMKVNAACAQLVLLVYKVTTVFNKVNAASSRVTTADRVTTARWIKTKIT